ncbi:MAG: hypothetical protein WA906_05610 [Pacificimonas sp.]
MTDPIRDDTDRVSAQTSDATPARSETGIDDLTSNKPLITAIVMLLGIVSGGLTTLVGGIMAYIFKGEVTPGSWEESHYRYHIRTFWGSVVGVIVATILMIVLIGFLLFPVLAVWLGVRCVLALIKANERKPMPNPETWLF